MKKIFILIVVFFFAVFVTYVAKEINYLFDGIQYNYIYKIVILILLILLYSRFIDYVSSTEIVDFKTLYYLSAMGATITLVL